MHSEFYTPQKLYLVLVVHKKTVFFQARCLIGRFVRSRPESGAPEPRKVPHIQPRVRAGGARKHTERYGPRGSSIVLHTGLDFWAYQSTVSLSIPKYCKSVLCKSVPPAACSPGCACGPAESMTIWGSVDPDMLPPCLSH